MELTYFGAIAILVGAMLLFFAHSTLLSLSVFFIPFSGTSVVNITKSASTASGLQPWMFFGVLYMAGEILRRPGTRLLPMKSAKWRMLPAKQMLLFFITILASLLMPLWINGQVSIESPYLIDSSRTPLYFGLMHITGTLFIMFGLLFTCILGAKCADPLALQGYLRLYCWSAFFVCLWGMLQLVLYHLNIAYPAFIFNSSVSPGAELYASEYSDWGLKRISSVSVEPSILAQFLLTVLPFLLFRIALRKPLVSRVMDIVIASTIVITLALSTSTTAYIGLVILLSLVALWTHRLRLLRVSHVAVALCGLVAVVVVVLANPRVQDLLTTDVVGKLSTGSGQERSLSISLALKYFTEYPLLGLGWGSVSCHDVVFKLLANTGILGLCSFVTLVTTFLYRLLKHIRYQPSVARHGLDAVDSAACVIAFVVLMMLNAVTEFAYVFGHCWFMLAVCGGIPLQLRSDCCRKTKLNGNVSYVK